MKNKCVSCGSRLSILELVCGNILKPIACGECNTLMKHSSVANILYVSLGMLGGIAAIFAVQHSSILSGCVSVLLLLASPAVRYYAPLHKWNFVEPDDSRV